MPRHILFLCHPDHGHVIPSLAVVTELAGRGHRVSYLTAPSMVEIVSGAGATAATYPSRYRETVQGSAAEDPGFLIDLLLSESAAMVSAALELPEPPDVVVYDTSVLFAGRVLAHRLGVPAVQHIPVFASNEHFSYLKAAYNPDAPAAFSRPAAPPSWMERALGRFGELCAQHGVDVPAAQLWFDVPPCNLVTSPREFQYAGDTFDDRFVFVGPCVADRSFLGTWTPPETDLPIVLISLGAVFTGHPDFFADCIAAIRDEPVHAVLSVADALDPATLGELPPNVEVHRFVPHTAVLEHAALCVSHGGMGTVLEALRSGTPVIGVPWSSLDGPAVRRTAELGAGTVLDPATLTAEILGKEIVRVLAEPTYTERAAGLATAIAAAGGAVRAADEIERR
ncbi:macrolide family glycosyltransferase [Pseudonocardia nematodicida]|uniref:Macrolide family glycosyltransferase n=1 Tax=Pseudonocardia nematodicida TaxID=1206997 RepID=A0ABV1K987_9PSEU